MEPTGTTTASHPLASLLDTVEAAFGDAGRLPVWSLDTTGTAEAIGRLVALESRAAALKLSLLAHAETVDVAGPSGAPSTAAWLAVSTRTTRSDAHRTVRLAGSLDAPTHTGVRGGLAAGGLRADQAQAIIDAVDALPTDGVDAVDADTVARAEAYLVAQAAHHDAPTLRILGRRLFEVVAPDLADAHEARILADHEAKAAQATRLTMADDGHGSVFVRAKIPVLHGAILKKALLAYAAPKHQAATAAAAGDPTPARRPSPERMGQAFCELLETLADDDLPRTGGTGATVVVTMDVDTLTGGLKAARLDTGERITADTARRLACQAGLVPAVLGTESIPLDLGRKTRFHTKTQRLAIGLRDGGCTTDGCDWPPGLCHIHHDPPWNTGGPTDIDHARMLCPHHHARAHDPTYHKTSHPNGKISFHRRC